MKLTTKQKQIVYGLILGDGYLQKTGKNNARLRLEHSAKQKDYIEWKYTQLKNMFERPPQFMKRIHPKNKKTYHYYRLQSHSSPFFGKLQKWFYENRIKRVPDNIAEILNTKQALAIWYMDDGYYYHRDKSVHIYIPKFCTEDRERLLQCLRKNFDLEATFYCRPDRKSCQINLVGNEKDKFFQRIRDYRIPSLQYKFPSPRID